MVALFGLGSNCAKGGRSCVELLSCGCAELCSLFEKYEISSVYETKAMYVVEQDNFYNIAVKAEVSDDIDPFELLDKINAIEAKFGRNRDEEIRFGPRSLDIDIEEIGELKISTERLILPHPRIAERKFVLIPMLEILNDSADEKVRERFFAYLTKLPDLENDIKKSSVEVQDEFKSRFVDCKKTFSKILISGGSLPWNKKQLRNW